MYKYIYTYIYIFTFPEELLQGPRHPVGFTANKKDPNFIFVTNNGVVFIRTYHRNASMYICAPGMKGTMTIYD